MPTCETCGGPCEVYEGEAYCPDCTRYEPAAAPPPPPTDSEVS